MILAPKFPLRFKEKLVFENVNDEKELVKFHMTNLLLTNPGEKISDPNYGVGVRQILFENMTVGVLNNWRDKISDAINKYLSYINLSQVEIVPYYEENKINIKIVYSLFKDTEQQILELSMNIGDTGTSSPTF